MTGCPPYGFEDDKPTDAVRFGSLPNGMPVDVDLKDVGDVCGHSHTGQLRTIFDECVELFKAKNGDYASFADSLANLRIEGWFGTVTRIQDKVSRMVTAREKWLFGQDMNGEKIRQDFLDTIVYLANAIVLYDQGEIGCWQRVADRIKELRDEA